MFRHGFTGSLSDKFNLFLKNQHRILRKSSNAYLEKLSSNSPILKPCRTYSSRNNLVFIRQSNQSTLLNRLKIDLNEISIRNYSQKNFKNLPKSWLLSIFNVLVCLVPSYLFLKETFLLSYFNETFIENELNCDHEKFTPQVMGLLYEILENTESIAKTSPSEWLQFHPTSDIECALFGGLESRYGALVYLPFYLNYNTINDIEMHKLTKRFELDIEQLSTTVDDDGNTILSKFKNALILSDNAKRFLILSKIHTSHELYFPHSLNFTMMFPSVLMNIACSFFVQKMNLLKQIISFLAASSCGMAVSFQLSKILDKQREKLGLIDALNSMNNVVDKQGPLEYLHKLNTLRAILYEYSGNKSNHYVKTDQQYVDYKNFYSLVNTYPLREQVNKIKSENLQNPM